jgi:hypothetical protein
MTTVIQPQKITQPVDETALKLPDNALRWDSPKK